MSATCVAVIEKLLDPKSFNFPSYILVVLWLLFGAILLGPIAIVDIFYTNKPKYFHCKSESQDSVQKLCYDRYQNEYTRQIPLYGFWFTNWICIIIVCVVYNLRVRLRVRELDHGDDKKQRNQQLAPSRWLYRHYCCQLTARLVLHSLFIILQTKVLYPLNFPAITYECTLFESHANVTSSVEQYVTAQTNPKQTHQCENPMAIADVIVCLVNGFLVVCVLIEMFCIFLKAKTTNSFMLDFYFFQIHFMGTSREPLAAQGYREKVRIAIRDPRRELNDPLIRLDYDKKNEGHNDLNEFDRVYTKLVICPDRVQYQFTGKEERHVILEGYVKSEDSQRPIDKLEDIFTDTRGKIIRTIMIVGRPGIGKSTLCKKIIRDIVDGKMSSKTTDVFVFLFKFRYYNNKKEKSENNQTVKNLNLQQWLSSSEYKCELDDDVLRSIRNSPDKVICIFDGLDEFLNKSHIIDAKSIHSDAMSFSAFYGKLLLGQLLAGATIITTSRPTALSSVDIKFDKTLEILGFTQEQVEECVKKVVVSSDIAEEIWQHINRNANLLSLCYIPVNCQIICISLLYHIQNPTSVLSLPTTLTEIYRQALKVLIFEHNSEYRDIVQSEKNKLLHPSGKFMPKVRGSLMTLGQLALKGTKEERLIFESSEVEGLEQCGLLHCLPVRQTGPFNQNEAPQFCFIHLIIQEFLSSWYMVQPENDKELTEFVTHATVTEGKWQVVVPFVAGLLHDRAEAMVTMFTDLLPNADIQLHGLTLWPRYEDRRLVLVLFKCIFEIAAESSQVWTSAVREKMQLRGVNISNLNITDVNIAAVVFVLQEVKTIPSIDFSLNFIGPTGCSDICKLLNNECKLTTLNISGNQITDVGVEHLSNALSKDNCKLTTLNISLNIITDEGVEHLSNALSKYKCILTTLNISLNKITDKGVEHLSNALSKDECKIITLEIGHNKITNEGAEHLSNALSKDECKLTTLNISDNHITVVGAKHLSNALSKDECKLTTLNIGGNKIIHVGVEHLSNALSKDECKLTTLDISDNKIINAGAQHLCNALFKDECKLTTLNISDNQITDEGAEHLSNALSKDECKLTTLDISFNQITDEGVEHLSNALYKVKRKLTILGIM